jgi:AAA+ ATPase superfamily predicted ATPase
MNNVILITGYARAGKDTLADGIALAASGPVAHLNFADVLKQACDSYMQSLGIGGSGATNTFRNEAFKVRHRQFLVAAGVFARSIDQDVFALAFTRQCQLIARCNNSIGIGTTIVCSDWRYMNEIEVVSRSLGELDDWFVHRVIIRTSGVEAANEEEGKSIGQLIRNLQFDHDYTFLPDSRQRILNEGKDLARKLGL